MTPIPVAQRYLEAHSRLESLLAGKSVQELWQFSELCFSFADLLETYPRLAAAFADAERSEQDKQTLLASVFPAGAQSAVFGAYLEQISHGVHPLLAYWIRQRAQDGGVVTLLRVVSSPEGKGMIALADELFELQEFLLSQREVRNALGDTKGYSREQRQALAREVFGSELSPVALRLLERAVGSLATSRKHALVARSLDSALEHYVRGIMTLSNCLAARVYTASSLSETQRGRVKEVLERKLGQKVHLQVAVDKSVLGGLKILVGSRVYDGTLASMFNQTKAIFTP